MSQILDPRVDGEALHAADVLPAAEKKVFTNLKTVRPIFELEEKKSVSISWSQKGRLHAGNNIVCFCLKGSVIIWNSGTNCEQ